MKKFLNKAIYRLLITNKFYQFIVIIWAFNYKVNVNFILFSSL